jgi:hypothetical protein
MVGPSHPMPPTVSTQWRRAEPWQADPQQCDTCTTPSAGVVFPHLQRSLGAAEAFSRAEQHSQGTVGHSQGTVRAQSGHSQGTVGAQCPRCCSACAIALRRSGERRCKAVLKLYLRSKFNSL